LAKGKALQQIQGVCNYYANHGGKIRQKLQGKVLAAAAGKSSGTISRKPSRTTMRI